ncbi:MAG: hypothetical protein M4579_002886 [Chaenotheca gracillima]|nr:MAG: hypothetical protein M4579_002886 [Chaenotheca gracillima]
MMLHFRHVWVVIASVAMAAAQMGEMPIEDESGLPMPTLMAGSPMGPMLNSPLGLGRRQAADTECESGKSPCWAIGVKGCCPNNQYCYINKTGGAQCCDNNSDCRNNNNCYDNALNAYQCVISSEKKNGNPNASDILIAYMDDSVVQEGAPHHPPSNARGNSCIPTVNKATINTASPSPTGCSTGSSSCAAAQGGGCCPNGMACTITANTPYCAGLNGPTATQSRGGQTVAIKSGASGAPTGTGLTPTQLPNGGLSSGAKAGIGVGVVLGVLLVLGLIAWFILRRRRKARLQQQQLDHRLGAGVATQGDPPLASQVSSPGGGSVRADYFSQPGTQATPAITFNEAAQASGLTTFINPSRTAVPLTPQSPGDIVTPVEIAESYQPKSLAGKLEDDQPDSEKDLKTSTEAINSGKGPVELL